MSVTLTDAQYGHIMWALREIACGYKRRDAYYDKRLSRDELITTAREVCELFGWTYSLTNVSRRLEGDLTPKLNNEVTP